jgi:hypothetical protein
LKSGQARLDRRCGIAPALIVFIGLDEYGKKKARPWADISIVNVA